MIKIFFSELAGIGIENTRAGKSVYLHESTTFMPCIFNKEDPVLDEVANLLNCSVQDILEVYELNKGYIQTMAQSFDDR